MEVSFIIWIAAVLLIVWIIMAVIIQVKEYKHGESSRLLVVVWGGIALVILYLCTYNNLYN